MTLDPRDCAVFSTLPMVMAPAFGELAELPSGSKRLIASRDGIYLEVRSPAMHCLVRISALGAALPYGNVEPFIRLSAGPVPKALLRQVLERGVMACPNETALAVVINANGDGYSIEDVPIIEANAATVRYTDTLLDDDRLVFDFHSHGHAAAHFSLTDDDSDLGRRGPYLALLAGTCANAEEVTLSARLCCSPFLVPLCVLELQSQGVIE